MKHARVARSRLASISAVLLLLQSCSFSTPRTIATIPSTTGFTLWEAEHAGAEAAALKTGYRVYWDAPTREDDVESQIQIVERVIRNGDSGLILAPDQSLALISPVRQAIAKGIPTVIVGTPLSVPPGKNLAYILNDDEETGRIVALRIGKILQGKGSIAVIGIDPAITAILAQVRAFETTLNQLFPDIHIIERRPQSYNAAESVQVADEILEAHSNLNAIWALTAKEAGGAYVALQSSHKMDSVKLVGCQQDLDLIDHVKEGQMDSVVVENTYQMGYQAVMLIADVAKGKAVAGETKLEPTLVTRENVNAPEVVQQLSIRWNYQH